MQPSRVLAATAGATLLTVVLAACGDDMDGMDMGGGGETSAAPASSGGAAETTDAAAAPNEADVMFVQMMIPHHEQAVVMADEALAKTQDPTIRGLAEDIRAAQQPEIDQMLGWLEEWQMPSGMGMEGMEGMDHSMPGMMTEEDLIALREASGADFDRMFAEMMIEHHEGAIGMATDVQADGSLPEVRALADEIVATQQAEIDVLQEWVAANGG